jgi:hypothetical protein
VLGDGVDQLRGRRGRLERASGRKHVWGACGRIGGERGRVDEGDFCAESSEWEFDDLLVERGNGGVWNVAGADGETVVQLAELGEEG